MLGHGSGKLLIKDVETHQANFDEKTINPVTGETVKTFYWSNETYASKFGKLQSSYEECRAESVALFLSAFSEPYKHFGYEEAEVEDIFYAMWLGMV